MEVADAENYLEEQKKRWVKYGCTILTDGWTGPTRLSIINIMVYCAGATVFLKSVDASKHTKTGEYIYGILRSVLKEIGKHNVVQVVTDNGSNYRSAGLKLQRKYHVYWTPCAAHCLDLMFEDIGKRDSVKQTIKSARDETKFIYNHGTVLSKLRETSPGEIIRPGATRFATNYLALRSLREKRAALRTMFSSQWWDDSKLSATPTGTSISETCLNPRFWHSVDEVCAIFEPMYTTLRLVDTEVHPTMGLLYYVFHEMKKKLEAMSGKKWVVDIVNHRWSTQMEHPLHIAAFFLNPKLLFNPDITMNITHMAAVTKVFDFLHPDLDGSTLGREV